MASYGTIKKTNCTYRIEREAWRINWSESSHGAASTELEASYIYCSTTPFELESTVAISVTTIELDPQNTPSMALSLTNRR